MKTTKNSTDSVKRQNAFEIKKGSITEVRIKREFTTLGCLDEVVEIIAQARGSLKKGDLEGVRDSLADAQIKLENWAEEQRPLFSLIDVIKSNLLRKDNSIS